MHGSASVLDRKRTFHLGDGKNVYVNVNGTIQLRKKEMTVVTIEAIEEILQRTEDCFNSSRTISVDRGVQMQCKARQGRLDQVSFRDEASPNDTITLNGNQFINLLVIMWHRYIFKKTPLVYAQQALLPLGNNIYVGVCTERPGDRDSALMFIRKFTSRRPMYQGINLNRTQTYTLFHTTQCYVGEKKFRFRRRSTFTMRIDEQKSFFSQN